MWRSTDDDGETADGRGRSGWLLALFNLTNTAIGAGTLALPFVLHQCGLALGVGVLVLVGVWSWFGLYFLTISSRLTDETSFIRIARSTLGPRGESFASLALFMLLMGPLSAYFNIIGSFVREVIEALEAHHHYWYTSRIFIMTVAGFGFMLPLSLIPSLRVLGYASFLALFGMIYAIWLVPSMYWEKLSEPDWVSPLIHPWFRPSWSILAGVCTIGMAYVNHANVAEIISDIKPPVLRRQVLLTMSSSVLVTLLYLVVGICGYLLYGDQVEGNVLNGAEDIPAVLVGKVVVALGVGLTFPLLVRPARECLDRGLSSLFRRLQTEGRDVYPSLAGARTGWASMLSPSRIATIETILIVLISYAIAILIPNLDMIFALFGAMTGSLVVFVLPGLFYVKSLEKTGVVRVNGISIQMIQMTDSEEDQSLLSNEDLAEKSVSYGDCVRDGIKVRDIQPSYLTISMVYLNCILGLFLLVVGTIYALIDLFLEND